MRQFAGQDEALQIAAGQRCRARLEVRTRKSQPRKTPLHVGIKPLPIDAEACARIARPLPSARFSRTVNPGTQASASGSSGIAATPLSRTLATDHRDASSPHNSFVPACGRRRPRMRSPSSLWPLPETPATPTIFAGPQASWRFAERRFSVCRRRSKRRPIQARTVPLSWPPRRIEQRRRAAGIGASPNIRASRSSPRSASRRTTIPPRGRAASRRCDPRRRGPRAACG